MRAVTAAEVEWIVGGLAKKMPVRTKSLFKKPSEHIGTEVEPPVTVTGTPITSGYGDTWGPGAPGGTGTGGGSSAGGGGGGGGGSDATVSDADKALIRDVSTALAKEVSEGLYEDDPGELAGMIEAMADLGGAEFGAEYAWMTKDIQYFENPAFPGSHVISAPGAPVDPRIIDWSAYDDGGHATPEQTIKNMVHSLQTGHKIAIDHNWSK